MPLGPPYCHKQIKWIVLACLHTYQPPLIDWIRLGALIRLNLEKGNPWPCFLSSLTGFIYLGTYTQVNWWNHHVGINSPLWLFQHSLYSCGITREVMQIHPHPKTGNGPTQKVGVNLLFIDNDFSTPSLATLLHQFVMNARSETCLACGCEVA